MSVPADSQTLNFCMESQARVGSVDTMMCDTKASGVDNREMVSTLQQARRRFMITDILNSSAASERRHHDDEPTPAAAASDAAADEEARQQQQQQHLQMVNAAAAQGLHMRLLFPHLPGLGLAGCRRKDDADDVEDGEDCDRTENETDTDNEADDDLDRGKAIFFSIVIFSKNITADSKIICKFFSLFKCSFIFNHRIIMN